MALNISRGADGLRPEGARELSRGFALGKLPLSKTPPCRGGGRESANQPFIMMFFDDRVRNSSPFRAWRCNTKTQGKPWAKLSCPFGAQPIGTCPDVKCHWPVHLTTKQISAYGVETLDTYEHTSITKLVLDFSG
jgi:hypothetical protein